MPNNLLPRAIRILLSLLLFFGTGIAAQSGPENPLSRADTSPDADADTEVSWEEELDGMDFSEYEEDGSEQVTIADPIAPVNRLIFRFNDKLFLWVLNPVARGYARVVPQPVRVGIRNFFQNLLTPIRVVNSLLQGRIQRCAVETGRFLINSTVGLLGFLDIAETCFRLEPPEQEDFGQTLALYGIGHGIYLVLPFLGPSSLRDGTGTAVDAFLNPLFYFRELESIAAYTVDRINTTSLHLGDYETVRKSALDPYESFKNIYLQYRKERIQK